MGCFQVLLSFVFLFAIAAAESQPQPIPRRCGRRCQFRTCGFRRAIISNPSLPITRPICSRNNREIGQILSVGEAKIRPRRRNYITLISRLRFKGKRPYRRNLIYPVRTELKLPNVSSLAIRPLPRDAIENLQSACIVVPITKWIQNGVKRSGRGCVAFGVQVPMVMVELQWDSNDDLDLFIVEPDGKRVFFDGGGGAGRLLRDVGRRNCGRVRRVGGKETIVYYANQIVKPGRYFVSAEHTKSCMETRTRWELRVVVKGRIIRRVGGVSRTADGRVIRSISFVV